MTCPTQINSGPPLEFIRGDTGVFDVTLTRSGSPFNPALAGVKVWFTLKSTPTAADAAAVLQKTIGAGLEITDAINGRLRLTLTAADTAALNPRTSYFWDIQVKDENAQIFTPDGLLGIATVVADRTRAIA